MIASRRRFTIQLPISAADVRAAALIARTIGHALAMFRSVDTRNITLVEPDNPEVIHRVYCGLPLDGGRRCVLRADHTGGCNRRTAR
jgi:hypothetical protein